jgi:hypothetical protein
MECYSSPQHFGDRLRPQRHGSVVSELQNYLPAQGRHCDAVQVHTKLIYELCFIRNSKREKHLVTEMVVFVNHVSRLSDQHNSTKITPPLHVNASRQSAVVLGGCNRPTSVGFFGRINPQHAFLRRGSKAVCPMSQLCGMLKNPAITWKSDCLAKIWPAIFSLIIPPFTNRGLSRRLAWSASGDKRRN